MDLRFEKLDRKASIPYDLLLLADETTEAIDRYVFDSDVYLIKDSSETIGVFCLYQIDTETIELKNIAITPKYQNYRFGSKSIDYIKSINKNKYKRIIVGTPDCATLQINFYEKNLFKIFDKRKNFFIDNYPEPIYENGQQLVDMVLLEYFL